MVSWPSGDHLPDGLVRIEGVAALVHIGELHGLADPDRARSRAVSWPVIIRKRVVLPAPFGPMIADDAAGREAEGHALDQQVVAVGLGSRCPPR